MQVVKKEINNGCPISFKILETSAGFVNLKCCFGNDSWEAWVDCTEGDGVSSLLEAAAFFSIHSYNNQFLALKSYHTHTVLKKSEKYGEYVQETPLWLSFKWHEDYYSFDDYWMIINKSPNSENKEQQLLEILINRIPKTECEEERQRYIINVKYKDFCYAVAKCYTDYLKENNIYKYQNDTWNDTINLRHLLIIKAFALGILSEEIIEEVFPELNYTLSFEAELKLLAMNM